MDKEEKSKMHAARASRARHLMSVTAAINDSGDLLDSLIRKGMTRPDAVKEVRRIQTARSKRK